MKDNNFVVIKGWMRTRLNLKGNELFLYAIVYGYSQDGVCRCKSSITYIEEALGVTRNTAIATRNRLLKKELIFKHKDRSTYEYSANIELVQNLHQTSAKTEPVASAKTEPNIYTSKYTNKYINVVFEEIWDLYEFKLVRKKAFENFEIIIKKIIKNKENPDLTIQKIKKAIPNYLEHLKIETWKQQRQLQYWIKDEQWNDEYEIKKTGKQSNIIHAQDDKYSKVHVTKTEV
jgi:hypothetical protein